MKTPTDLEKLLEDGLKTLAENLVERVNKKEFSAADAAQLRAMAREMGITLTFQGRPTPVGDSVLESLKDVDPDLLN